MLDYNLYQAYNVAINSDINFCPFMTISEAETVALFLF